MTASKASKVEVPLYIFILAGSKPPLAIHRAIAKANIVDWERSQINISPLQPWVGHVDMSVPKKLMRRIQKKYPDLHMEVIKIQVRFWENALPKQWGEKIIVHEVKP